MTDIIAVTADSLRADHCGWQSDKSLTPNLDEVAADGVTFSDAIAPGPRTLSSVPVSNTGVPFAQTDHNVANYGDRVARIKNHITQFETVSEQMSDAGYTTIAFTANPWTSADNGFDTGFDEFNEVGRTGGELLSVFRDTPIETPVRMLDRWIHKDTWFSQWRTFYDEIVDTLETVDGPVFAWIFLLDTHNPYLIPRADREESSFYGMYSALFEANDALNQTGGQTMYRASLSESTLAKLTSAYRDSVRSVDAFVGQLNGDFPDAKLLFHSDHGEAFGDHETYGHEPVLYEENIHVPLVVANGEQTTTVEDPVSTAVIPEILLDLADDSFSDPEQLSSDYAVARTEDDSAIAVRGSDWKYIRADGEEELYDLRTDPGETTDVSDEEQTILSTYRDRMQSYIEKLPTSESTGDSIESQQMKSHLESLGYL